MHSSLTLNSVVALFGAMVVLAALPSVSVLAVSTRSATLGLIHGVFTTLGIMLGDIVFIIIAIKGLSFLAETMGRLFVLIKYLSGAYLIALGIGLLSQSRAEGSTSSPAKMLRPKSTALRKDTRAKERMESSLLSSFIAGLMITLGDQKAVLFYLGFFPNFLDISNISYLDTIIILSVTIVALGGVKLGYAILAVRARLLMNARIRTRINTVSGYVMIAIGLFVLANV